MTIALWQPRIRTARRPRLWPWLHAMANHIKRGASGHMLRNVGGHLIHGFQCCSRNHLTLTFSGITNCFSCYDTGINSHGPVGTVAGTYDLSRYSQDICRYIADAGTTYCYYNDRGCSDLYIAYAQSVWVSFDPSPYRMTVYAGSGTIFKATVNIDTCRFDNFRLYNEWTAADCDPIWSGVTAYGGYVDVTTYD